MDIDQLEELLVLLDISSESPSTKPEPLLEKQSVACAGNREVDDDNVNLIDLQSEQLDSHLPSPVIILDSESQAIGEHVQNVCLEEISLLEDINPGLAPLTEPSTVNINNQHIDDSAANRKRVLKMNRLFDIALEATKDCNHIDPNQEINNEVCTDTSQLSTLDPLLETNDLRSKSFIEIIHYSTTGSLSLYIKKLFSLEPGFVVGVAFITPTLVYIEFKDSEKAVVANSLYYMYNKQGSSSICPPSKDTMFMAGSQINRLLGFD